MATYRDLSKSGGGNLPVNIGVFAIGDLPAASADNIGCLAVVTGTAHATITTQLAVSNGTTWKYADDGVTTVT